MMGILHVQRAIQAVIAVRDIFRQGTVGEAGCEIASLMLMGGMDFVHRVGIAVASIHECPPCNKCSCLEHEGRDWKLLVGAIAARRGLKDRVKLFKLECVYGHRVSWRC